MKRLAFSLAMAAAVLFSGSARAALEVRGLGTIVSGGSGKFQLIYDTVLDITWLDLKKLGDSWPAQTTWVEGLEVEFGGKTFDNWRLPQTLPVDGSAYDYNFSFDGSTDRGYNISAPGSAYPGSTASEMAHLYYTTLGNLGYHDLDGNPNQPGWGLKNTGPFINLQAGDYWSGTQYGGNKGWNFWFYQGWQDGYDGLALALPVHPGDVGAVPDTTPPGVVSTSPPDNATDVSVNPAISATFSEAMNVSTIDETTFLVNDGTADIGGTVTYNDTTAFFTPDADLNYDNTYTASITTGAQDLAGNPLANDYQWSFATETEPDITPPAVKEAIPHHNAGIVDSTRVPCNTSFAARIEDSHGIDLNDTESIKFTINDSVNPVYERDLSDKTLVRVLKLTPDPDTEVTTLWVVYDRSMEVAYEDYSYDANVNIKVDAKDRRGHWMTQTSYDFKIETETEHADAEANSPETAPLADDEPALDDPDYADAVGIEVTSGELAGLRIVYDNSEPVQPTLAPADELPPLDVADMDAVGAPINLKPPTVFDTPVKVIIPLPIGTDVASVSLYLFNGTNWVAACDADGNVLAGGDGCVVSNSRVNNDPVANQPNVAIKMYHFTGVQATGASSPALTPTSGDTGGGGGGGSSGGCFIATAVFGAPAERHVIILRDFRDRYLLPSAFGRILVRTYNGYSPPLAHFISKHDILKVAVRISLLPLVAISHATLHFGPSVTLGMVVVLVALSTLLIFRFTVGRHRADGK